jgi:hypothetical protein
MRERERERERESVCRYTPLLDSPFFWVLFLCFFIVGVSVVFYPFKGCSTASRMV